MHIRINDFAGTFPKLHPTKLPDVAAQSCMNMMVEHGILGAISQSTISYESNGFPYADFKSAIFFEHKQYKYKKFDNQLVSFVFSPVHDSHRLYWTTEDSNMPLFFTDWDEQPSGQLASDGYNYIAGMPPVDVSAISVTGISPPPPPPPPYVPPEVEEGEEPPKPPPPPKVYPGDGVMSSAIKKVLQELFDQSASASGVKKVGSDISDNIVSAMKTAETRDARIYAFTYVNKFGDESVPAVKENIYYINEDDKPVITLSMSSGARSRLIQDYGVRAIRLYRSVAGSDGSAQFLFVKEFGFNAGGGGISVTDTFPKGSLMLGEVMPTVNYDPPRRGMKGLGVTDFGVGYAYVEKTICLSEPYLLYAWPKFYELSTQHKIMGMGHYDNTIVVATTGNPVLINGVSPESMSAMTLPLYEGCVSSRSMVNLDYGCMYASNNGLVLVTTNSAKLLTAEVFSAEDWQKILPSSIHACAYKNGYLFFWKRGLKQGSGYIDLGNPNKGVMWFDDYALNTFLDDGVVQMVTKKPNGFGVMRSVHQSFNPEYGDNKVGKTMTWRSKTFNTDTPKRFLAGQVIADSYPANGIVFKVYSGEQLIHESRVRNANPFRIANHSAKRDFSIEVQSNVPIRETAIGETMRDMLI